MHGTASRGEASSDLDAVGTEDAVGRPPRMVAWRPGMEAAKSGREGDVRVGLEPRG